MISVSLNAARDVGARLAAMAIYGIKGMQAHRVGKTGFLTPDISKPREQVTRPSQLLSTFLLRSSLRSFTRSSLLTPTLVRR